MIYGSTLVEDHHWIGTTAVVISCRVEIINEVTSGIVARRLPGSPKERGMIMLKMNQIYTINCMWTFATIYINCIKEKLGNCNQFYKNIIKNEDFYYVY